MQKITSQVKLGEITSSQIPLGFKKIHLKKIPPHSVEKKLMLYNEIFDFHTMLVSVSSKPISKILY
jgi:hypothetical protein